MVTLTDFLKIIKDSMKVKEYRFLNGLLGTFWARRMFVMHVGVCVRTLSHRDL